MLTADSIEERVWETLRLKKSLFAGVFDSPTGEISFAKLGRKTGLEQVKEIFAGQPDRPKPVIPQVAPVSLKPVAAEAGGIERAVAGLFEAGAKFIESIATEASNAVTRKPTLSIPLPESLSQERFAKAISGLVSNVARAASASGK
jgi:hypothetical protein